MIGAFLAFVALACLGEATREFFAERRSRRRTRGLVQALVAEGGGADLAAGRPGGVRAVVDDVAARTGGWVRRALRRPAAASDADLHTGRAVLTALVCLPILGPVGAAAAGAAVRAAPVLQARRHRHRCDAAVHAELPDVVDLLALGVAAGLNLHLAIEAVAHARAGPVTDSLAAAHRRVAAGEPLADALGALLELGEPVRVLHDALVGAQRHGVPVRTALDRIAAETRATRRRRHEEAARKLPVRLLFPLVLCTLPALGLLTVVPLVATSLPSLVP